MVDLRIVVVLALLFAGFLVPAGFLDRRRIQEYIDSLGEELVDIAPAPSGRQWFRDWFIDGFDRIYSITYRDREAASRTVRCRTRMFSDAYLCEAETQRVAIQEP